MGNFTYSEFDFIENPGLDYVLSLINFHGFSSIDLG